MKTEKISKWELDGKVVTLKLKVSEDFKKIILFLDSEVEAIEERKVYFDFEKAEEAKKLFEEMKDEIILKIMEIREILDVLFEKSTSKDTIETNLTKQLKEDFRLGDRIFLYGETGTGKTKSIITTLEEKKDMGILDDFIVIPISSGMEDVDLLARYTPTEKGNLKIVESSLSEIMRKAKKERVAVVFDEINRAPAKTLNIILKLIDNVEKTFKLNNFVTNETIEAPAKNISFYATANLGGYAGTFRLDEALFDRFNKVKYVGYQNDLEEILVGKLFGDAKEKVLKIRQDLRKLYRENILPSPFSTRMLINWGNEYSIRKDLFTSALETFIYRLIDINNFGQPSEEQIKEIEKIIKEA